MARIQGGIRGRVVGRVAGVAFVVGVLGLGWAGQAAWRVWPSSPHAALPALPAVSAAPAPLPAIALSWIEDPPRSRERFELARQQAGRTDPFAAQRLVEWLDPVGPGSFRRLGEKPSEASTPSQGGGLLRVEYSLDERLTENVFEIFRRGRVKRGLAIVLDPRSGRLLAYVATDPETLPPERAYPAASIVKILTAATLLQEAPVEAALPCVYRGNKYRLSPRKLARPPSGRETSLEEALATSNNQCFSQWAVHVLGEESLRASIARFGWLVPPAPGHAAGRVEPISTNLQLGRLGSGLAGVWLNPLHVAALASVLTDGRLIEPWWIDRVVDSRGRSLELPRRAAERRVLTPQIARRLRSMLVATTTTGTAKRAFRTRRGRPLLPGIAVAGKTGNLTGGDPFGRYEWFFGLAPAEDPTIAVVVLQVQSNLWWSRSSELAAKVLHSVFCEAKRCRPDLADRWTGELDDWTDPLLISERTRPQQIARAH